MIKTLKSLTLIGVGTLKIVEPTSDGSSVVVSDNTAYFQNKNKTMYSFDGIEAGLFATLDSQLNKTFNVTYDSETGLPNKLTKAVLV